MKIILGTIICLIFLIILVALAPRPASANRWINVLPGTELFGCVPNDLATHLLSGGFTTSGTPVNILCSIGYTAVYRVLP